MRLQGGGTLGQHGGICVEQTEERAGVARKTTVPTAMMAAESTGRNG